MLVEDQNSENKNGSVVGVVVAILSLKIRVKILEPTARSELLTLYPD